MNTHPFKREKLWPASQKGRDINFINILKLLIFIETARAFSQEIQGYGTSVKIRWNFYGGKRPGPR